MRNLALALGLAACSADFLPKVDNKPPEPYASLPAETNYDFLETDISVGDLLGDLNDRALSFCRIPPRQVSLIATRHTGESGNFSIDSLTVEQVQCVRDVVAAAAITSIAGFSPQMSDKIVGCRVRVAQESREGQDNKLRIDGACVTTTP